MAREYRERVAKKSFIITTLLMPVLMLLFMAAPAAIQFLYNPEDSVIAVDDASGFVLPALQNADMEGMRFQPLPRGAAADTPAAMAGEEFDGVLTLPADMADNPRATLYLRGSGSFQNEMRLRRTLNDAVQQQRLKAYDLANLDQILDETRADTNLQTVKIDAESGDQSASSSELSYFLGLVLGMLLFMVMLMYGQMVMNSIIEEKGSRVLDLVITTVKPFNLMMGKILGVGATAVTQILIWGVLVGLMSAFLLPALLSPEMSADIAALQQSGSIDQAASQMDLSLLQGMAVLSQVGFIVKIFFFLTLFLVGGFLFYASMYAAIGSAVDNVQDAAQLASFMMAPIMFSTIFDMMVAQYPDTTLAVVLSFVPFTSPVIVMTRMAYDIPMWQVWTSLAILFASAVAMTWLAGKIYRVGVFMHGRKPSLADLWRWANYK